MVPVQKKFLIFQTPQHTPLHLYSVGVSSLPAVPEIQRTSLIKFPKNIGPQFVNKAMPWFELFWHNKKRYPSDSEIMGHFKFTAEQVELLNMAPFWRKCCEERGIRLPDQQTLSALQVAAISLLTNFSDRRSIPAKMAAIGVSPEQLDGWYKDREFQQELSVRTDEVLEVSFPEVQAALIKQVQKGNFSAIKFYYEMTGRATTPEQIDLKRSMQILVEAVQKHVQDPAILEKIGQEVRALSAVSKEL